MLCLQCCLLISKFLIIMYKNQRHIMAITNKRFQDKGSNEKKNYLTKQFSDSYQSQETAYDDECQHNQSFTDSYVSDESDYDGKEKMVQVSQCKEQKHQEDQEQSTKKSFHSTHQKQIQKDRFLSVSKLYENEILQQYKQNLHNTIQSNYFIKSQQTNLIQRQKKLTIIQKLLNPINKTRFNEIKQKIISQPINLHKIDSTQMQINFYKCECQFATISKQAFRLHLKRKSHKIQMRIQTQKERKNQQKLYVSLFFYSKKTLLSEFGQQLEFFSPSWLYKSFEVIFIEGGIHWQLYQIKRLLLREVNQLKLISSDELKKLDLKEPGNVKLKKSWQKIYINLHKVHKGNQRICHKCMSIDQHLELFVLGLMEITRKSKYFFGKGQQDQKCKFQVFLKLMEIILAGMIDESFYKQINTTYKFSSILEYHSIKKMILKLLKNYIKNFDYIDLQYQFSTTTQKSFLTH